MILVTGSQGFLGKRVCRHLQLKKKTFLAISRNNGPNLLDIKATISFFIEKKPLQVINCAAYVGGIQFGYKYPAEIFHQNLIIALNLFEAARISKVQRIVNPISNCIYPGSATYFKEDEIWNGPMHESVMAYGFARRAFLIGAWAYAKQYNLDVINLILSNMYGPEDHFDEERSHALGALIMKIVKAKDNGESQVIVWGSGQPVREWLHVDDGAEAMVRALDIASHIDPINIGVGKGISIIDMAIMIKEIIGYKGDLILDSSKPDGARYKSVDGSRGAHLLKWVPQRNFRRGVIETIDWYMKYGR